MGKYDFIKLGNLLYWHDPDSGLSNGVYQVASIPENIEEDSVILIASDLSLIHICHYYRDSQKLRPHKVQISLHNRL